MRSFKLLYIFDSKVNFGRCWWWPSWIVWSKWSFSIKLMSEQTPGGWISWTSIRLLDSSCLVQYWRWRPFWIKPSSKKCQHYSRCRVSQSFIKDPYTANQSLKHVSQGMVMEWRSWSHLSNNKYVSSLSAK